MGLRHRCEFGRGDQQSYKEIPSGSDTRFTYNFGAQQSIATSNAQNDSGVFELNFRDERYMPFEGAGAISSWGIELSSVYYDATEKWSGVKQFDYDTISDVILHVKYTSRDGDEGLKTNAKGSLENEIKLIRQARKLQKRNLEAWIKLFLSLPNCICIQRC